jgi:hypothetical protein
MSGQPPAAAPFQIHSIRFNFTGGHPVESKDRAILLRDHVTDDFLGANAPEWVTGRLHNEPAAYVRATRPHVRVVFRGSPAADGEYGILADGHALEVAEARVRLTFDPATNLCAPVDLRARNPLPDRIGAYNVALLWYARSPAHSPYCLTAGGSNHRIYTTWRAMTPDAGQQLHTWVYRQLVEWTCEWAAWQDDAKGICDAIIRNIESSGLRYGQPLRVGGVRDLLRNNGGMCGDWYKVFQQMAHCQGVFVHRRAFLVDWRVGLVPVGEERWCAIVIRRPGLNQPHPTHPASDFEDNDTWYPIPTGAPVNIVNRHERRYQFFGAPGFWDDGHCINFLVHRGRLYLYDACFGVGPVEIDAPLPVPDLTQAHGGAQLASFKVRYLDDAIDYMLGSLYNGEIARFHRCIVSSPGVLGGNGMTVRTRDIPEVAHRTDGLTFFWSD